MSTKLSVCTIKFFNQPYHTPPSEASKYKPELGKSIGHTERKILPACVLTIYFFILNEVVLICMTLRYWDISNLTW